MTNQQSKEQFIKKLEDIVEGVVNTKIKIKRKNDEEKSRKDEMNSELLSFVDVSRKYALVIFYLNNNKFGFIFQFFILFADGETI